MSAGALGSPVFDFTSLDYSSVQKDLIRFAQAIFPTEIWTDFNDSNAGMYLLQMMAYITDLLAYNANAQALETIATTVTREQNFRTIARTFDYTLKSATPSSGDELLTIDPGGPFPFTISKHLQFATADGVIFQPAGDVAVAAPPPGNQLTISLIQGQEHYQETIGTTDGTTGQQIVLSGKFLIDGTLTVNVGIVPYTQVTDVIQYGTTDTVFTLNVTEDGTATLTFGDGVNGTIPPINQTITATYKVGGGTSTNVAKTLVKRIVGSSDGSSIPPQILAQTNPLDFSGGGPKQSLANAKANLPLSLKANDRGVAESDYGALAVKYVAGVFKAIGIAGLFFGGSYPIILLVVPNGGGYPSNVLKNQIVIALKDKKLAGKRIRPQDPVYVNLNIAIDAFIQPTAPAVAIGNAIQKILDTLYSMDNVDFGQEFAIQDAYEALEPNETASIAGLKRVYLKTFSIIPYYARHLNAPSTGNGVVVGILADPDLARRREWLIVVSPSNPALNIFVNQFTVYQRQLGTVSSVTDSLVVDETADYALNSLTTTLNGWVFHPNPEQNGVTFPIIGNTDQTITSAGGLLSATEAGDDYVVEKKEGTLGRVKRMTVTAAVTAGLTLTVDDTSSIFLGDPVVVSTAAGATYYTTVANVLSSTSVLVVDPVTVAIGDFIDYLWISDDGSVKFAVVDGSIKFVVGDQLYVDTYQRTGDLKLRRENFPLLNDANVTINLVGGVK